MARFSFYSACTILIAVCAPAFAYIARAATAVYDVGRSLFDFAFPVEAPLVARAETGLPARVIGRDETRQFSSRRLERAKHGHGRAPLSQAFAFAA